MSRAASPGARAWFDSGAARGVSLAAAAVASLVLTLQPGLLARGGPPDHGLLALGFLGLSAMFVHGVGFVPRSAWLRALFHPLLAWPLAALPLLALVLRAG